MSSLYKATKFGASVDGKSIQTSKGSKVQKKIKKSIIHRGRELPNIITSNYGNNLHEVVLHNQNTVLLDNKTVNEWEHEWNTLGCLSNINISSCDQSVGVLRARLSSKVVYIGGAIEWSNGGFSKKLSDYIRDSDSGRKHGSGKKVYENRNSLIIDIIVTGSDENASEVASNLEKLLIMMYTPEWNKMVNF